MPAPFYSKLHHFTGVLRVRFKPIEVRLMGFFWVKLVIRTTKEMSEDDATHMAAGVAYYALFSLFPLLIGLLALFSFFLGFQTVQIEFSNFVATYLPGSETLIESNIDTVRRLRGTLGVVAFLGLFWSGSAIFGAISRAINRAWDIHQDRPFYSAKPRQLAMAVGVGLLFIISMGSSTFVRIAGRLANQEFPGSDILLGIILQIVLQGASWLLAVSIFLVLYKFLPYTKTYWRYVWPGAVLAGILFELGKNLFVFYLNRFANFDNFGTFAPIVIFLLWSYISSLILILGAEFSSEYGRLRTGIERGALLTTEPKQRQ